MNQFLIERICQKIDPFQSPSKKKISSNNFVKQLSERKFLLVGKQNPPKLKSAFLEL